MNIGPKRLARKKVLDTEFITIHDDEIRWPDGALGRHVVIGESDAAPGVVVLPTHAGEVGLVRVFRYPLGRQQWGLPRGFAHSVDPLVTAAAELREEMGVAGELRRIGEFTPDSGLMAGRVVVVHAAVADPVGEPEDTREVAETAWMPWPELAERLGNGEYDDGMTLAAVALAITRGVLPAP